MFCTVEKAPQVFHPLFNDGHIATAGLDTCNIEWAVPNKHIIENALLFEGIIEWPLFVVDTTGLGRLFDLGSTHQSTTESCFMLYWRTNVMNETDLHYIHLVQELHTLLYVRVTYVWVRVIVVVSWLSEMLKVPVSWLLHVIGGELYC